MIRRLTVNRIKEDINKGKVLGALLQASADLEHLFFIKLLFEKGLKKELIENWTLGKYIKWVSKLDLIDPRYISLLNDFNRLRNLIVHERYVIHKIEEDLEKSKFVKNLILSVCDFLDSTPAEYEFKRELEDEYIEFSEKIRNKYDKVFKK